MNLLFTALVTLLFSSFQNANFVQVNSAEAFVEGTSLVLEKDTYVTLTFRNNSAKSIPLIIPTVMNPNLSPFSNSGVTLKIGQKVFFKYKGKKRVLIEISKDNYDGEVLDVSKLLKQRKKAIDMK